MNNVESKNVHTFIGIDPPSRFGTSDLLICKLLGFFCLICWINLFHDYFTSFYILSTCLLYVGLRHSVAHAHVLGTALVHKFNI